MDDTRNVMLEERLQLLEAGLAQLRSTVAQLQERARPLSPEVEASEPQAGAAHPPYPEAALPAREIFCPRCGGENSPLAFSCGWCGNKLRSESDAAAATMAALPVPLTAEPHTEYLHDALPQQELSTSNAYGTERSPEAPAPAKLTEHKAPHGVPVPSTSPTSAGPGISWLAPRSVLDVVKGTEYLLNKVGIALFLFGVAFLFKYAIDSQWYSEQARVATGLALGTILLTIGLRLHKERRHFSQVLMGGSIAAYYITGYAAYNIFPDLKVPYEAAFGFMSLVTFLAFVLSVRQDETVLSHIGLAGGLLTPFVLTNSTADVPILVSYTCVIIAGTTAIYLSRGWRSLLWNSLQGIAGILIAGLNEILLPTRPNAVLSDRWALQCGAAFVLLAFWAIPTLREVLSANDPDRWPRPSLNFLKAETKSLLDLHVPLLVLLVPLGILAFSSLLWSDLVAKETWGSIAIGGAVFFAMIFWRIRVMDRWELNKLAYTHALVSIALLTVGLLTLLRGDALLLALTIEGAVLHLISRRFSDVGAALSSYILFAAAGMWLAVRLIPGAEARPAIWNTPALVDLGVISIIIFSSLFIRPRRLAIIMGSLVHIALLAWIWREGHGFPNGDGYVMLAWAAYGLLLHVVSRRLTNRLNSTATSIAAHLAFDAALAMLALRLVTGYRGAIPIFNDKAITDLAFIALALAASFTVQGRGVAIAYRLCVHTAVLGWLWREATQVDLASGYVMFRWAAYLTMVALISHKVRDQVTLVFTNIPYVLVALLFAQRIAGGHEGDMAMLNTKTLIDVAVLWSALTLSFVAEPRPASIAFRLAAHAGALSLLWRELSYLPGGEGYVMLSWAIYLTGLQLVSYRLRDRITSIAAHLPLLAVGGLFLFRVASGPETAAAMFNQKGLIDLSVIVLAASASLVAQPREAGVWYRCGVHVSALAWLWRELHWLPSGYEYVMLAWAAYATLLHMASRLTRDKATLSAGRAILATSGIWLLGRIAWGLYFVNQDEFAVLNPKGLANLGVIALAGFALLAVRPQKFTLCY
ncbi:MAG: DUF2339 domain-containing protein, partial [Chloroflexota bacterium]|nr:DUF2339 domain-containing protein [Chloroflexota bacterium]